MTIIESAVTFADAMTDEGVDYGTGYYVTHHYSDGHFDFYGPYDYEEDARSTVNPYFTL